MKKIAPLLCISTILNATPPISLQKIYDPYPPFRYMTFDAAMQADTFPNEIARTKWVIGIDGTAFLDHCRTLYDAYNPFALLAKKQTKQKKIPKIIHQIWIGKHPLPEVFQQYMKSWADYHMRRGWWYKLWTDDDLADFVLENQHLYDETDSVGVKSDLLRYEILYRYGGVYIDTDFECLQPLDLFHELYDLYTGLQPLDTGFAQLGIALIGCVPGHPVLEHTIKTVKEDWHRKGATVKTGPIHFTKSFYLVAGSADLIDIALPAYYFYPQGCKQHALLYDEWKQQGAYAIHHWAKSWMPLQYRPLQFRVLKNEADCGQWDS